jgi:hypothetical protein
MTRRPRFGHIQTCGAMPALALALVACAMQRPLTPVTFDEPVSVTSDKSARVRLVLGGLRDPGSGDEMPSGETFFPVIVAPLSFQQFDVGDQQTFVRSLRAELTRLRIFGAVLDDYSPDPADVEIQLLFARTVYQEHPHRYTLDVGMRLMGAGPPVVGQYHVVWELTFREPLKGKGHPKVSVATKLLNRLVPDIAAYVATSH